MSLLSSAQSSSTFMGQASVCVPTIALDSAQRQRTISTEVWGPAASPQWVLRAVVLANQAHEETWAAPRQSSTKQPIGSFSTSKTSQTSYGRLQVGQWSATDRRSQSRCKCFKACDRSVSVERPPTRRARTHHHGLLPGCCLLFA